MRWSHPAGDLRVHGEKSVRFGTLAVSTLLALLVGCGGEGSSSVAGGAGGTGGDNGGSDGGGNDGGPPFGDGGGGFDEDDSVEPPPLGSLIGRLELAAPANNRFLLHGTLPIQKGIYPRSDGQNPFAVIDSDGTPVASQTEIVSRWPNATDGADVVEILARVTRPAGAQPGDRIRYDITLSPHPVPERPQTPNVSVLNRDTLNVPPSINDLLSNPHLLQIRAKDVFGNVYPVRPLTAGNARVLRHGLASTQLATYETMTPETPVEGSQGTLDHFLGVHSYLSTYSGDEALRFDVRLHNGFSGADPSTSLDDPLQTVYFRTIEVLVPQGWVLQQSFEDPFLGASYSEGDHTVWPLVKPNPDGKAHVIPWQGQFHRRLAVSPPWAVDDAGAVLREEGQAFSQRGVDSEEGHALFSWWNPVTDRYFPQRGLLPSLDHVGLTKIRGDLRGDLNQLSQIVRQGNSMGGYPVPDKNLGWAHPWGVTYGGMTGGLEIWFFDGVPTAAAASTDGLRYSQLLHRMVTDRQPVALYNANGRPTTVDDWVKKKGTPGAYIPFNFYLTENLGGTDPFGYGAAERFQMQYVEQNNLKPKYQNDLFQYDPLDIQHYNRWTRSMKTLAWLSNDAIAKDDLVLAAELFHLSFHPYFTNANGGMQETNMRHKMEDVIALPRVGAELGRAEGWGWDSMNAAYAIMDRSWRDRKIGWYRKNVDMILEGQSACSGFVQSVTIPKILEGKYHMRQAISQYIQENGMRGMIETVFRGVDNAYTAMLRDILRDTAYAALSPMAWEPGASKPWSWSTVGPLNNPENPYCSPADFPAVWNTGDRESHQQWSPMGYAYELTEDPIFLDKAGGILGPNGPLAELEAEKLKNIENTAGILALLQRLNGDL